MKILGKIIELTRGVFGTEFRPNEVAGIRCGQIRPQYIVRNGGWYNKSGGKLGWGDLNPQDFLNLTTCLEEGEMFIILPEQDSFWAFVTRPGIIGSMAEVKPDVEHPGAKHVASHALYAITHDNMFLIDRYGFHKGEKTMTNQYGLTFKIISPEKLEEMMKE